MRKIENEDLEQVSGGGEQQFPTDDYQPPPDGSSQSSRPRASASLSSITEGDEGDGGADT